MIKMNHLTKTFDNGKSFVVNNVSLSIDEGKTLVLLGSSGCGKTTTLKMINRLIEPTSGDIEIDERNIRAYNLIELRRSVGYVFQKIGLFPHLTIAENVGVVLALRGESKTVREKKVKELLELVNLNPAFYANRYPNELSGGQQQRVGVARALANRPKYLLMDEPFGALDAVNRDALQTELIGLREQFNITIIFVTHDIFEALRLGDKIAVMNRGRIEQLGTGEEIVRSPKTEFVKSLFDKPKAQLLQFKTYLGAES